MQIKGNGNVQINTNTDAGFRLDVNGTARVQGVFSVVHNDNNYVGGVIIRNNNTTNTALSGLTINNNGTNVGQFVYQASNYIDANLRNTVLFSSIGLQKLGFIANASNSGTGVGSDIYFKTRASNANNGIIIFGNSQSVAINSTTEIASAQLEIASTTKGFLPPRMTEAQRTAIASPATGLIVYQTDGVEGLWLRVSTGWVELTVV
jgi:hypothetical protein